MNYIVTDLNNLQDTDCLGRRFAEIITSPYNDQVTVLINGSRGSGKSYLGLDLAIKAAQNIARIKGGNPSKYFSLDTNVAVIRLEYVLNIMESLQQYSVYFLDDIGVGYSSREWRSQKNIRMNKIVQTFRTDNVMTILSVPDKMLIDKVPREMVEKYMETNKETNMYSLGLNIIKVFNLERLLRDEKTLTIPQVVEHRDGLRQYSRYVSHLPPSEIVEPYEARRKKIAADLRKEEAEAVRIGETGVTKVTDKERLLELDKVWKSDVKGNKKKYGTKEQYLRDNGFDNYHSAISSISQALKSINQTS